jgi:hypothetical protein
MFLPQDSPTTTTLPNANPSPAHAKSPDMHRTRPTATAPVAHTHPDRHSASMNRRARSTIEGTL